MSPPPPPRRSVEPRRCGARLRAALQRFWVVAIVALAGVALVSYAPRAQAQSTCDAPDYTGDHVQIWTGELTVGTFTDGGTTYRGFISTTGELDPTAVRIDTTDHTVNTALVQSTGTHAGRLLWNFASPGNPTDAEIASLTLHVCDESFPLRGFGRIGAGQYALVNSGLDWSAETTRNLYISRDTTIPTLQSAVVDGDTLELTYNEPLYEGGSTGASAFDVTIGTADAVNPEDVTTSGTTVTLTLPAAATSSDAVTLTYTKPGTTTDRVQDVGGNEAVALSSQAVTNKTLDEVVLVSNTAQQAGGTSDSIIATSFETGTNLSGYIVSEVSLRVVTIGSAGTVVTIRENNSSNRPGDLVETLTNPTSLTANTLNVFTAPADTTLDAGETYWITVNEGLNTNRVSYNTTSSNAQTGQTGWTIADGGLSRTNPSGNWSSSTSSLSMEIKGFLLPNTVPTAADGSVGTTTNTPYTFEAGDFNFADDDEGDELETVKIVTLPDRGTLALEGTAVTANQAIMKSDIDDGDLTFTPATGATGSPYTTFTFKVNDGDDDSASAYTMTVNVLTSSDATLSAITVTEGTVHDFAADRRSYEVGVASTVTQTTVSATTNHIEASVEITPADADAADGHQVDLSPGENAVTIVVTADNDSTTKTYELNVNRGVADDYGWKAVDDFDTLAGVNIRTITGIWSDGTTMWVGDSGHDKLYAFTSATKARDSSKDFNNLTGVDNVWDIWSDGTTMWMLDTFDDEINAFNLATKARESGKDFTTLVAAGNNSPTGIWSNGETMWVTDSTADKIFAYNMATKARDQGKDFDTLSAAGNNVPFQLWSYGSTMWVGDTVGDKLYAYNMATKARDPGKDFNTLTSAGNGSPRGIWSDGRTMWVAQNNLDPIIDKIYSYNMPDRPSVDMPSFDPNERGPYGDPIKAVIAVNSGWQPFTLETRVADEWFATDLERNKRYFIRINTAENTRWPRLSAAFGPAPDHLQHTHGSGADCSRGPGGRGCAGHGWFEIWTGDESHPAGRYYFHVNAPHSITEQPDEDFPPGENPYEYSIRVEGPTDGSGAPPSPLTAEFSDAPREHNGSEAFALQLTFDDSIKGYAADVSDSITVTNGALTAVAQNEWDINRWDLTVTPSGAENITVELAASGPCDEEGALCTFDGRVLETAVRVSVEYVPPPPTITSVSLVTDAGDNDAWDVGELVTAEVVFSAPVNIQGRPTLGVSVTGARREAAYASGDATATLRFSYRITSAEAGAISAGLISNGFDTATGIISDTRARLAILDFEADQSIPLTGQFQNSPANHGGADERFAFNIQFSVEPVLNASTIRNDIFTVTNGDITKVRRTTRRGENRNSRWLVWVEPDGDSDVSLTIPVTTDCRWFDALCNADGTKFSAAISLIVAGPDSLAANSPAAGAPAISGTVQVGETLTADTSGISDADGLTSVAYTYQWLADDVEVTGATGSTYTLAATDQGKTVKVRVSFTDDAGFSETRTSDGLDFPVVALEGFFDETTVPHSHNGANSTFTFELYFNAEPTLGFKDVRDDVLTLTNGSVTRAARTNPHSDDRNSRWTITVAPVGNSAVTIAFGPTTDCTANSAVCTTDAKMLSNSASITVVGP